MASKSSPRDFSLFSLFTAGLACLVPLASAYTQAKGPAPKGNPIHTPGLHDVVPVGKAYGITWNPTTEGTVTLVLLKGPSNNAEPLYPIAQKIENDGKFVWTPSEKLEPGITGYGIQLICDATGQYQYTTQFGISNPHWQPHNYGSSAASSAPSIVASSGYAAPTGYHHHNGTGVHPTGYKHHNTTRPHPTHHVKPKPTWHRTTSAPVPSGSAPAPTTSVTPPKPTGAASTLATSFVGLVFAAGVAVFVL